MPAQNPPVPQPLVLVHVLDQAYARSTAVQLVTAHTSRSVPGIWGVMQKLPMFVAQALWQIRYPGWEPNL